jgi:ubiquinone/menaquinone biosynthesis C-methylase UbiE
MLWLTAALYDLAMRRSEEVCLARWRAELLRELSGAVLEIGAGTGACIPYYPKTLTRLDLSEPDPHMRRQLQAKCRTLGLTQVSVFDHSVDDLRVPTASYDAVVCSFLLCSVPNQQRALSEIRRVLKPRGQLVFLEHVAADTNQARLRWQQRIEPVWKLLMGNCHLTRHTEAGILDAGFQIERIDRESIRKVLPIVRPSIRGIARTPF